MNKNEHKLIFFFSLFNHNKKKVENNVFNKNDPA